MGMIVRKATLEDAAGIAKVHVETWKSSYRGHVSDTLLDNLSVEKRLARWKEKLSDQSKVCNFVAKEDGEIVGFSSVGPCRDEHSLPETGELYSLYVSPSKMRKGVGAALLKVAVSFLKEKGYREGVLWTISTNDSTIAFYKRMGWELNDMFKTVLIEGESLRVRRLHILLV